MNPSGPSGPITSNSMGYYTYFSLSYHGTPEDEQALQKYHVEDDNAEYSDPYYINGILDGCADHDYKWYDWEKDIKVLASKFPNVLFILDGDGEENEDHWEFRIKGKVWEHHYVEMPPFTTPELINY